MATELPIATAPIATPATPPSSAAGNAAEAGNSFEDLAAETQTFMKTLSQLLEEGAIVVAAPTQNVQDALNGDHSDSDLSGDALGTIPAYESLLSLLLPSQTAANQAGVNTADMIDVNAPRRPVGETLPLAAANAATLQKTLSKTVDATVAMEFEAQLSAQTAGALLGGTDKAPEAMPVAGQGIDGVGNLGVSQSTAAGNPARSQLVVGAHVGTPAWADEVAAKATFIHERGLQSASLRLSPEHLGPMEIQITINDDKASVWFGAAHAETRTALEQALPRLRELLGSQGLSLSDAGVFREPPRDQAQAYVATRADGSSPETVERDIVVSKRIGLLDTYA